MYKRQSEGRKFGLGLLVISQRPARVDKNVISQCNTQIILRVTNPNDIKALSRGLEFMSSETEEEIKRIPQGVALLSSPGIELPILVDVRVRRSEHGGRAVDFDDSDNGRKEIEIEEQERKKSIFARLFSIT